MRPEIGSEALRRQSRFGLCHLAFIAIRKLHEPGTRIEETAKDVLQRAANSEPELIQQAEDRNETARVETTED